LAVAGLAIALYIAVIDAAVETFRSGSPVRWWVVGVVAAYLALNVGLWRYRRSAWQRIGWSALASASFFLLLGLLAFTVWLPGGLTDGIRVVGQSTSRVLSLITAVVIMLAGISLVRLSWLPRWAKVVAGLLAAYGLAAFVVGIVSGAEFAALLHGDSLWTRLPAWLQGAFLGAFVVVPAGLVLHAAHMLKAAPGVSRAWDLRQGMAMAMGVLIAVCGHTRPNQYPQWPIHRRSARQARSHIQPAQIRVAIARLKEMGALPPLDPQELAARGGGDPEKILAYVRNYFTYEPYVGILRGGRGALLSDGGNDLDLLLLLQDAIRAANPGISVHYVHAPLPPNYSPRRRLGAPWPDLSAQETATITGLNVHEVESDLADSAVPDITPLRSIISEEADAVGKYLSGVTLQSSAPPAPSDHWWLRVQLGNRSVDLDPVLDAGDASHKAGSEASDLPDSLYHRIGLQLVLERIQGDKLVEEVLYRQEWKTADLAGTVPSLEILPEGFALTSLDDTLSKANRFQAIVHVGEKTEYGRVFDLDGSAYTANGNEFVKTPMESGVQEVSHSIFGQLANGPGREATASAPSQLAGVRLQIQISSPEQATRTYRRWIVDRIDRDAQARGQLVVLAEWKAPRQVRTSLLRSYGLFPILGPIGASMVASDAYRIILDADLADEAAASFARKSEPDANTIRRMSALPETVLSSVAALGQGFGSSNARAPLMLSRPGVLLYRESLKEGKPAPVLEHAIDIVATGATGTAPSSAVRYGVALSYAELDVGAEGAAIQPLEAARRAGVRFRVLRSPGDVRALPWPIAAKTRLAEQLAGGSLALVPENKPTGDAIAWWRIDPTDGVPISTSYDGEGQAVIEGTILLREGSIPQVQRTMAYVFCLNVAVGGGDSPEQGNAQCLCESIGDNVRHSAQVGLIELEMEKVGENLDLGEKVEFLLTEGVKFAAERAEASSGVPDEPIKDACKAITH
jgi:hypothetical protein